MIVSFWDKNSDSLISEFGPTGLDESGELIGFGFILEGFISDSFPAEPREREISDFILEAISSGDRYLGARGVSRSTADRLLIKISGSEAVIYGLVEAKTSSVAVRSSLEQLGKQERVLRAYTRNIKIQKRWGYPPEFFRNLDLRIEESLEKILLVPLGEKESITDLPEGWTCREAEISYDEMVFLAKLLWPEFRPSIEFGENQLAAFERGFLSLFYSWGKARLRNIFQLEGDRLLPLHRILLFTCITEKIPIGENEIREVIQAVGRQKYVFHQPEMISLQLEHTVLKERKFLNRFLDFPDEILEIKGITREELREQIMIFLFRLREFRLNLFQEEGIAKLAEKMEDFDILKIPSS